MNVWAKYKSSGLNLNDQRLELCLLEPMEEDASSHAVKVTNIPRDIPEEIVHLYFENASGGDIETICLGNDASEAVIVFGKQAGLWKFLWLWIIST